MSLQKKILYFGIFPVFLLFFLFLIGNSFNSGDSMPYGEFNKARDGAFMVTKQPEVKSEQAEGVSFSSDSTDELVKVVKVIDGDTIKIETGEVVRLIGIDAPETLHPSKPVACFGKESSLKAREIMEGEFVELEKDVSDRDKYGRLLRYVWKKEALINEILVREGYAMVSTYPPNIKYQNRLLEAQKLAREENKGLWAECNGKEDSTETEEPSVTKRQSTHFGTVSYICDCSKTCNKITSCEEAQYQLEACGCKARDGDGDGIACDSLCQ